MNSFGLNQYTLKSMLKNENGLTLIELLAVIVILGIIAVIAILSVSNVIERSKEHAIVSNAYALRDAGNLYAKQLLVAEKPTANLKVSYSELLSAGFLNDIIDPDTKNEWERDNLSYIVIAEDHVTEVCLKGAERSLCAKPGDAGIKPSDLSIDLITANKKE